MTDHIRDAYDHMAQRYTAVALGDLDRATPDREWIATFARLADLGEGAVADLGCGPGYVTHHLAELGLTTLGYDISPALIAEARSRFPDLEFRVGDITALDVADSSLAGIVARYSLIHAPPADLAGTFAGWSRVLEPGAPALVSFFAADSPERHGVSFDHAVVTAYELFPATVVGELEGAGFDGIEVGLRSPLDGERPLDHATILARRSTA